jgi:hypothetical protein
MKDLSIRQPKAELYRKIARYEYTIARIKKKNSAFRIIIRISFKR